MITKFKPKCVYAIWRDDVLKEGCKGYMADSVIDLQDKFDLRRSMIIKQVKDKDDAGTMPFCESESEVPWTLCYYDPYEPFTRAYDDGATIMFEDREVTEHELEYEELDVEDLYVKSEVATQKPNAAEIKVGSVWRNCETPACISMITNRTSEGWYQFAHNPTKFTAAEIKAYWQEVSYE